MMALDAQRLGAFPLSVVAAGAGGLAFLISATLQPIVRRVAVRRGVLDRPDGERRTHGAPIPRLGGIGVFVALLIAGAAAAAMEDRHHLLGVLPFTLSVAASATLLFITGLVDDLVGVRPAAKVVVQSLAAIIVWYFGFHIDRLVLPGGPLVSLGLLGLPVVILWIVGLSNAFNLVDGADGLAGGVSVIALVATVISAFVLRNALVFWISAALIGAMVGFLKYNVPPARIFLGDSGSLVVGFLLAVLTVKGMTRHDGAVFALGPIFALSYPLLDTGISILRRWLRREPFSRADGRHIHHQLRAVGLGPRQSLIVLLGLSSVVAVLGVSVSLAPPEFTIALALAGAVILAMLLVYGARWLQYHELLEAGASLATVAMKGRTRLQDKIYARDVARVIQQAQTTQELRAIIEDNASTFRFAHMQLRWGLTDDTPPDNIVVDMLDAKLWSFDFPIIARRERQDPLFLSVWCNVDDSSRSAGAERVTQILAPAVERWVQAHPELVLTTSFVTPPEEDAIVPGSIGRDGHATLRTRGSRSGAIYSTQS